MAKRNNSYRKSVNDLLNNENRFQSMYSQAFKDHSKREQPHNKNLSVTPSKQIITP